jgi:hypothetical protein
MLSISPHPFITKILISSSVTDMNVSLIMTRSPYVAPQSPISSVITARFYPVFYETCTIFSTELVLLPCWQKQKSSRFL